MKCIYAIFKHYFQNFESCATEKFIFEIVLQPAFGRNRFIMAIFVNTLAGRWTKWKFTKWPIKGKTWRGFEFIANGNSTCLLTPRSWIAIWISFQIYITLTQNLSKIYVISDIFLWMYSKFIVNDQWRELYMPLDPPQSVCNKIRHVSWN